MQYGLLLVFTTSQWGCLPNIAGPKKAKYVDYGGSSVSTEDVVASRISFDEGTETDYDFDDGTIELTGGLARLKDLPEPEESEEVTVEEEIPFEGMSFGIPGGVSGSGGPAIGPGHYTNSQPTIFRRSPIQLNRVVDLVEVLGPAGCPAGVRYTISMDGLFWFYFNGVQWFPADGSISAANSISGLKEGFSLLSSASSEQFYIRAHLNSSGSEPCELDQILITGKSN